MRTAFAFILLLLSPLDALIAADTTPSRPNIVLIISDQHFADAMSCAGYAYVKTPALDRIAATGVRFCNTYCTYPVCMSSRASLMTGLWPHQLKGTDEEADPKAADAKASGKKSRKKNADQSSQPGKSLGTLMKEAGYRTAYFGKWHVGGVSPNPDNRWHGFDTLVDGRRDEAAATEAAKFIESKHDQPFFLVVSFLNPHDICEWARMRSGIQDEMGNGAVMLEPPLTDCPSLPNNFAIPKDEPQIVGLRRNSQPERAHPTQKWSETEWRQYRWAYARLIEKMDEQVGRVMAALKSAGQLEQTVVVYTADHGDGNAAHHWNQKMVLYEEAVRVPLIVSWPGHTMQGKVDDTHLVSMGLDLLPTFADYAGVKTPPELSGRSVRPLAEPTSAAQTADAPHFFVVSEVNYKGLIPDEPLAHGHLLRTSNFTYIIYSAGRDPEQLFDIRVDPGQTRNLVNNSDYQTVLKEHRQLLRGWIGRTKSPFPVEKIP